MRACGNPIPVFLASVGAVLFFVLGLSPIQKPACAQQSCSLEELYVSCGGGNTFGCITPTPTPVPNNPWIKVKSTVFDAVSPETFRNFLIPQNNALRLPFNEGDSDDINDGRFLTGHTTSVAGQTRIAPGVLTASELGSLNSANAAASGWAVDGYDRNRRFSPKRFLEYANARKDVKVIAKIRDEIEANRINIIKPPSGTLVIDGDSLDNGADQLIITNPELRGGGTLSGTITAQGSGLTNGTNMSGSVVVNGVIANTTFRGRFIGPGPGGAGTMTGSVVGTVLNGANGPVRGSCSYTGATVTGGTALSGGQITGCALTGMNAFILVVDGDLEIKRDINHCRSANYFTTCTSNYTPYPLAIVVTGNTIIRGDGPVGQHVNTINAVLVTENLTIEPTNGRDDFGLKIRGNLIVNREFTNQRSRADSRRPVLFVVQEPAAYISMLPYFSTADYAWKQIQ